MTIKKALLASGGVEIEWALEKGLVGEETTTWQPLVTGTLEEVVYSQEFRTAVLKTNVWRLTKTTIKTTTQTEVVLRK